MGNEALRVAFKVSLGGRRAAPKPAPGAKLARQRQDREARKARNLALAYWIDGLIRVGEVPDLAGVARMCRVSRARISKVAFLVGLAGVIQEKILTTTQTDTSHNALSDRMLSKEPRIGSLAGSLHGGRSSRYTSNTTRLGS